MRGLGLLNTVALLPLSVPALARPSSNNALSLPTIAYLTLESPSLPVEGEEPQVLQLWLQLYPSGPECSDAEVRLMNQRLHPFDEPTTTFSSFGRGRRASFDAAWSFNCPPLQGQDSILERTALVTVYAVNSTAPGNNRQFAVNFRQTFPPEILSVHGAAHRIVSVKEDLDLADKGLYPQLDPVPEPAAPEFLTEWGLKHSFAVAKEKINLLERLNDPEKMKEWKIDHGILPPPIPPVLHVDDPPTSPLAQDEDDDEYTPPSAGHNEGDDYNHVTPYTPDQGEHPLTGTPSTPEPSAAAESAASLFSAKLSSLLQDQDLTTILAAAFIFCSILSLLFLSLIRHRQQVKSEEGSHGRRWWHSTTRHESTAERLARRFNRRHARVEAIKAWFGGFLGRLFAIQEKDTMPSQQVVQQEIPAPVVAPTRAQSPTPSEDMGSTTMEQELAQFREAAMLVGNLIAAEEGLPQRMTPTRPVPSRHRPRLSMESDGFVSDDDPLPTYEELAPSSLAVQDGFRYTPHVPIFPPSSPSEEHSDSNNSDRLGYNK